MWFWEDETEAMAIAIASEKLNGTGRQFMSISMAIKKLQLMCELRRGGKELKHTHIHNNELSLLWLSFAVLQPHKIHGFTFTFGVVLNSQLQILRDLITSNHCRNIRHYTQNFGRKMTWEYYFKYILFAQNTEQLETKHKEMCKNKAYGKWTEVKIKETAERLTIRHGGRSVSEVDDRNGLQIDWPTNRPTNQPIDAYSLPMNGSHRKNDFCVNRNSK